MHPSISKIYSYIHICIFIDTSNNQNNLFIHPSVSISIHTLIHPYIPIHQYIYSYIHPSIHLYIYSYIHPFINQYIYSYINIYSYTHPYIHTSIMISIHTIIHPYIHHPCVYLFIHSSIILMQPFFLMCHKQQQGKSLGSPFF